MTRSAQPSSSPVSLAIALQEADRQAHGGALGVSQLQAGTGEVNSDDLCLRVEPRKWPGRFAEAAAKIDNPSIVPFRHGGFAEEGVESIVVILAEHHQLGAELVGGCGLPVAPDAAGLNMDVPRRIPVGQSKIRVQR